MTWMSILAKLAKKLKTPRTR